MPKQFNSTQPFPEVLNALRDAIDDLKAAAVTIIHIGKDAPNQQQLNFIAAGINAIHCRQVARFEALEAALNELEQDGAP
jgi:hypothetical protein